MSESMWIEIEIPDDCVDAGAVVVAQYLDSEGELNFVMNVNGDLTILAVAGLLEAAKHRWLAAAEREWVEEEEDLDD